MKKIGLFLGNAPHDGGAFQYNQAILDAICELPRNKFTVVVVYTSTLWLKYIKPHGLETVFVKIGLFGRILSMVWRTLRLPIKIWRRISQYFYPVVKTLKNIQCDLWIFPAQDALSYQVPVNALITIHDLMHRYERRFPEVSSFRWREWHYRNICKWAKGVLVDSEIGKQHVIESYGMDKEWIHILPYIAPKYLDRSIHPSLNFYPTYNLPLKFIFYPAQFWEHKNHKRLIMAINKLKKNLPDLKLVLVGSKKNGYKSAFNLVKTLKITHNVIFLGYVPDQDMAEIYHRARALIMPTFFGPTNIPPLEAFVAGCPIGISDIYGIPEQVGDAALLFNPESVDEIAECIRTLWVDDHLCAELARKGKQRSAVWGQRQFNDRFRKIIDHIVNQTL